MSSSGRSQRQASNRELGFYLLCRTRRKQQIAPDQIKQRAKRNERNQREQIGVGTFEEWIMRSGPSFESFEPVLHRNGEEGEEDAGERAPGDVAGGKQDAVALVSFRDELIFGEPRADMFASRIAIDQPAHHTSEVDWRGGGDGQINTDCEGESGDSGKLEHDRDKNA